MPTPHALLSLIAALTFGTVVPGQALAVSQESSPAYTWADVPGFNGKTSCLGVDLADDGTVLADCGNERIVSKNGAFRALTATDRTTTYTNVTPSSVAATGWVGGMATDANGIRRYVRWTPQGELKVAPDVVAGPGSSIVGINVRGDLAFNHATDGAASRTAHVWWADTNVVQKVPSQDNLLISSGALSDGGTYVGAEGAGKGSPMKPFTWTRGGTSAHFAGFTKGSWGTAQRVSSDGRHVVGWSERKAGDATTRVPVLFRNNGTPIALPATPWDQRLSPLAITNAGAVLLSDGVITGKKAVQLSTTIAKLPAKTQVSAVDMDNKGRILAMFMHDGAYTLVFLTPTRS